MLGLALALAQATPTAAAPLTLQAQFEQANAAIAAKQYQQAVDGFAAIEARPKVSQRSIGLARLRKGIALIGVNRPDAAADTLASGLALTAPGDTALTEFRVIAAAALGELDQDRYDYVAARRAYDLAVAETDDPSYTLAALLGLIQVTMFNDSAAALNYADRAEKVAIDNHATPELKARVRDLRGRALLNRGDLHGAIAELGIALKLQGGLTEHTDTHDAVVRSDLAIADLLAKDETNARELMAMTGAGRTPNNMFALMGQIDLPPCGGDLRPDDVGVIEFSVGDDGSVRYADPIYASRPGMAVLDLARAVHNWVWRADSIAKVPLFYRTATRVEVRCSTAAERPLATAMLGSTIGRWFDDRGIAPQGLSEGQEKRPPAAELQAAIDRESKAGGNPHALIALLLQLGVDPTVDYPTRAAAYARALELVRVEHAPPAVIAWIRVSEARLLGRMRHGRGDVAASLLAEAETPEMAADAKARAALVLDAVDEASRRSDPAIVAAITRVANDSRLDSADPLRVGALLRLSTLQAKAGDLDAARKSYLDTGLSAQQCALVDARPARRGGGPTSSDYPDDAMRWGVSGWTRVEFDILADGHTTNRRAVVSYPPFTFSDAAAKGMRSASFTQSYRPEGGLGCGGASQSINFTTAQ